jgi:hypothetical protein
MHSTGVHSINAMPDNASILHNIDQAMIDRWFIEHRFTDFASRFNMAFATTQYQSIRNCHSQCIAIGSHPRRLLTGKNASIYGGCLGRSSRRRSHISGNQTGALTSIAPYRRSAVVNKHVVIKCVAT